MNQKCISNGGIWPILPKYNNGPLPTRTWSRIETQPPDYTKYTTEQLNMRRKAEILLYKNNSDNQSKAKKWSYLSNSRNNIKICSNNQNAKKAIPSSYSDVPGKKLLVRNESVPLYNFKVRRNYLIGNSSNISMNKININNNIVTSQYHRYLTKDLNNLSFSSIVSGAGVDENLPGLYLLTNIPSSYYIYSQKNEITNNDNELLFQGEWDDMESNPIPITLKVNGLYMSPFAEKDSFIQIITKPESGANITIDHISEFNKTSKQKWFKTLKVVNYDSNYIDYPNINSFVTLTPKAVIDNNSIAFHAFRQNKKLFINYIYANTNNSKYVVGDILNTDDLLNDALINIKYPGYILFDRSAITVSDNKLSSIPSLWIINNDYTINNSYIYGIYLPDNINATFNSDGHIENKKTHIVIPKVRTFTLHNIYNTRCAILTHNRCIIGGIIKHLSDKHNRILFECYEIDKEKNSIENISQTYEITKYGIDNRGIRSATDDIISDLYIISNGDENENKKENNIFVVPLLKDGSSQHNIFYKNAGLYKFFNKNINIQRDKSGGMSDISYNIDIKCWREISEDSWNYNTASLSMQYNKILNNVVVAFDKDKILLANSYTSDNLLSTDQKIIENTKWYSCDVNNSGDAFIALGNIRYSLNKHHTRNFIIFSTVEDDTMSEIAYPDFLEYEKINDEVSISLNKYYGRENTCIYMQFLKRYDVNDIRPEFYIYCLKDNFPNNWTSLQTNVASNYIHSYNVNNNIFDISNARAITEYDVLRPNGFIYMKNFYVNDNFLYIGTEAYTYDDNNKIQLDITYGQNGYYEGKNIGFDYNITDCGFINLNLRGINNPKNYIFGVAFIANNTLYTGLINEDIHELMDTTFSIDTEKYEYSIVMINTYNISLNKQAFLIGIHDTKNPSKISFIKQGEVIGNNNNITALDLNDWKSKIDFTDFSNISFSLTNGYIDETNSENNLVPIVIYFCLVTNKNYTDISEQSAVIYVYYSKDYRKSKWGRLIYNKNNDNKKLIVSNNSKITYCQENNILYIFDNDYNKITKFSFDKNNFTDYIDYNLSE